MYRAGLLLYLFLISVSARVIPDSFHDADVSIGVPVALQKRDINIQFIDWDDQDLVGNLIDGSGNTVSNPTAQVTQEFNFAANLAQVAYESITGNPSFTNTAEWMRWFGAADTTAQTTIRNTFQNIASLYSPSNTHSIPVLPGENARMPSSSVPGQIVDVNAFVTTQAPQGMTLFGAYWRLPPSAAVVPPAPVSATNDISSLQSRATTILHELMHFSYILPGNAGSSASAPREVYPPIDCQLLANARPADAALNPQSLMWYAIDIYYGWSRNRSQRQPSRPLPPVPGGPSRRPLPPTPSPSVGSSDPAQPAGQQSSSLFWFPIVHFGKFGNEL
ncbi:hypothetical protein V8E54_015008 [Elaphomyces granulatus]